jgi:hypothetical protein
MAPQKLNSQPTRLRKSSSRSANRPSSGPKFIPNLTQINEASAELPDPEIWPEASYKCPIEVDGRQRHLEFALKQISRGSELASRWIYEGKILIRKRDL